MNPPPTAPAATAPPKVRCENYAASYGGPPVLRALNLELRTGECLALLGPAGSGKSTLLRSLNRLAEQTHRFQHSGRILLDGRDIFDRDIEVVTLRQRVGLVASLPLSLPSSIYDNIAFAIRLAGERRPERVDARVVDGLRRALLWDEVKDRLHNPAQQLWSGQQQLLCLARALALEPEVLLLDEPTAGLDAVTAARLESALTRLKTGLAIVVATHDSKLAARVSDRTALLWEGTVIECAPTREFFSQPRDPRALAYITGRFT